LYPIVSVIIPTFNRAYCIERAISSVLNQTFQDFEIIVIDNFSEDNTEELIKSFGNKQIKYCKYDNKGVISLSRNKGIYLSKSKYIAFLDSDDWWKTNKLEISIGFLESGYDFICHGLEISRRYNLNPIANEYTYYINKLKSPFSQSLLKDGNTIDTSSVILRRDIILSLGGFSEQKELSGSEDYDMWFRVSCVTNNFYVIKENLGFLYFGEDNFSNEKKLKNAIPLLIDRFEKLCQGRKQKPTYLYFLASSIYLRLGYLKKALKFSKLIFLYESRITFKIQVLIKLIFSILKKIAKYLMF